MHGYCNLAGSTRKNKAGAFATLAILLIPCNFPAWSQEHATKDHAKKLTESSASNPLQFEILQTSPRRQEIQVFGGANPLAGDWSSIAITKSGSAAVESHCTATLVGRDVVLTAAHCVVIGDAKTPSPLKIDTLIYRCTADPDYLAAGPAGDGVRTYTDFALCVSKPGDARPVGFEDMRWERIDLRPVIGTSKLLVAGFGCKTWTVAPGNQIIVGPLDRKLTVGDFSVSEVDEQFFNSISDGKTKSALCAGDSGGPAFFGISTQVLTGARTVRGVASKNRVLGGKVTSYFTALSSPAFRTFLECWLGGHQGMAVLTEDGGTPVVARTC